MPKIYILGSVGSGKTTLAKKLSLQLGIPFYELDNVVWEFHLSGDIRRSKEEIEKIFNKILNEDNWIIEGVERPFFDRGFDEADTIIYLDLLKTTLYKRIFIRWIKQKVGLEQCRYKPDIKMLKQMIKWVNQGLAENKLQKYQDKLELLNEQKIKGYTYKKLK
ncbi:MAG TPA: DNA topology modulation protein FlaR [Bacilli bacterium]|mgnify:CR=1 FL=1|nr:DNA topology modulation protein FlaR [Bacilli bacterium]